MGVVRRRQHYALGSSLGLHIGQEFQETSNQTCVFTKECAKNHHLATRQGDIRPVHWAENQQCTSARDVSPPHADARVFRQDRRRASHLQQHPSPAQPIFVCCRFLVPQCPL